MSPRPGPPVLEGARPAGGDETVPPPPRPREDLRGQLALIAVLVPAGWLAAWLLVRVLDAPVGDPRWRSATVPVVAVGVGLVAALVWWSHRRTPRRTPALVVAATSVLVSGLATFALHGTRWSYNGLYSDAGFRTEAVTRFADSPALADYGYRGLPGYYPPALPWVQGRVADLVGIPGWAAMKPVMLVLAALVPVLAYLVWRRVLPDVPAALVASSACVATLDLVKPDEWLVLCLVLPWWLDVVRGLRSRDRPPVRWWLDGAMLGGLLLVHSFYFLPLAVASVAGVAVDALLRRPLSLRLLRAVVIGVVGLAVATPYWGPLVWLRLRGLPSDSLQVRWSRPGFEWPPLPGPDHTFAVLGLVGVGWLLWRVRSSPLALSVGVTLLTTYLFFLGGQWLQRYDVAVLPEKSDELIVALLVVSGVLGLVEVFGLLLTRGRSRWVLVLVLATVVATAVTGTVDLTRRWVVGRPALAAQQMRYPDGTFPAGGIPHDLSTHRHPWGVSPGDDGPSVDQVRAAWRAVSGAELGSDTVLVSARADLLATTPVHPFTAWKSIYSHPNGRFLDRVALLREVGDCATPDCAWRLLTRNRFDRVDGLVLTTTPKGLQLSLTTDVFPDGWVQTPVVLPSELFRGPHFERRDVRGVAVVRVR